MPGEVRGYSLAMESFYCSAALLWQAVSFSQGHCWAMRVVGPFFLTPVFVAVVG